ncbi:hypothetical protein T492DRAFT_1078862, partial [Pavlovales sp. CCMP2436]
SLLALRLLGDRVPLHIRLATNAEPVAIAYVQREFVWAHGPRSVSRPMRGAGGEAMQVAEAWYPADEHAISLVLSEGDRLSPHAYAWLKYAVLRYRYADAQSLAAATRGLLGIGLQPAPPAFPRSAASAGAPGTTHAALLDAQIRSDALCLMPESWVEFHESVSTEIARLAPAAAPQTSDAPSWQTVLSAMTGKSVPPAPDEEPQWPQLLDKLAVGSRWTAPSSLLRPHFVDADGVPLSFIETARSPGYAMRLATTSPFGRDERVLPSVKDLTRVASSSKSRAA